MKTLNLTLRTILLILILVNTTITAFAYDMYVNGVYYNINGDEATVTYQNNYTTSGGTTYYESDYSGHVTIPENVTYNGLTYTVTGIGSYAFYNRYSSYALRSISIPITVKTIGDHAFSNCDGLISITFPISIKRIYTRAFEDCDGLTSVTIPDSVNSIGAYAFQKCDKLNNIVIGKSVTSIGNNAFSETPLASITCLAETPPALNNSYSYFYSYVNTTLYVPSNSIQTYRTASVWSNFKIITDFKPNFFSLDDVSAMHGDTIVVPVMMDNENDITAFQTDIYLVEGFEVVKDGDDYLVELSDRKGRDHVIMANETPDGAIRVASYSPTLKTYKNNDGVLFYLTVKVPENGDGVYPLVLKNTRLTTIDEDEVLSPDTYCNVAVAPFIKGDANESGDVTIADVVVTAMYMLFQNPEPFNIEAADMNGDNKITITDVVKIANLILDQDYEDPENMRMMAPNMAGDHMSGEAKGNSVSINLDNEMEYTALQLDLTLPERLTASDFALTERASNLSIIQKDRGNGKVRVVAYTPDLKTIMGNDGAILTFNVDGEMGGDIIVDRIEVVNTNGESVRLAGFNIHVSTPTALTEITTNKAIADVKYFNLAGQAMTEPANGVTLVVTTYNDGTRTTSKIIR